MLRVLIVAISALHIGVAAHVGTAWGQTYPDRPVKLVVPFPPGGGGDAIGRLLGTKLTDRMGQPVVVDNKPGANGAIGTGIVAKSKPDGYTLGLVTATLTVSDALGGNSYDLAQELSPVILLASSPMLVTVNNAAPDANLSEFIARAKANPGKLNYGSTGIGGIGHVTGELFKMRTGTDIVHIPYSGGGPLMAALLANQVDVIFADAPPALPQMRAGKVRVLAVTAATRSPTFPSVPTALESAGLQKFQAMAWYGLMVPAGTPKAVVERVNTELNAILTQADVREALKTLALDPQGGDPELLGALVRREVEEWKAVIKATGLARQ